MSRTRHHDKFDTSRSRRMRKLHVLKQKYARNFQIDDWYIETPVTKEFNIHKIKGDRAWI
jgi:hypothetical protein